MGMHALNKACVFSWCAAQTPQLSFVFAAHTLKSSPPGPWNHKSLASCPTGHWHTFCPSREAAFFCAGRLSPEQPIKIKDTKKSWGSGTNLIIQKLSQRVLHYVINLGLQASRLDNIYYLFYTPVKQGSYAGMSGRPRRSSKLKTLATKLLGNTSTNRNSGHKDGTGN